MNLDNLYKDEESRALNEDYDPFKSSGNNTPKSAVIFEKNKSDAKKANSNDPITALGYKLYRTFRYITNTSYNAEALENTKSSDKFVAIA